MKKEEMYLELLKNNKLEELRNILETNIISSDSYISALRQYFKEINKDEHNKENNFGYHIINNNRYISDTYSCFKLIDNKYKKILKELNTKKATELKNILEILLNELPNEKEMNENKITTIDIFNENLKTYEYNNNKYIKVNKIENKDIYLNKKYLITASKLFSCKKIKFYMNENSTYKPYYIMNSKNNIIGFILPLIKLL